ncbi:hypothetical protein [Limnobacter litoralis]|uniref:Uncharacterized protein n=1 Tax=Limnobacter litoralis TaxID=481366 RepID=A0ABQ5YTB1_9BURK|nr:hypothetical protein [Limnobacter litoralis]GLR26516.1 hypothetical protein GCM10007875_16060 [Limnobacter litoralis]
MPDVKMKCSGPGVNFGGEIFEAVDGFVMVPVHAVQTLISHGLKVVEDEIEKVSGRGGKKAKTEDPTSEPTPAPTDAPTEQPNGATKVDEKAAK